MLLGLFCVLLIAGQGLTFFSEDPVKRNIDRGCYVLLSLGILYWFVKLLFSYKRKLPVGKLMSLAVANSVWIVVALFMSSGLMYNLFFSIETFTGVYVLVALIAFTLGVFVTMFCRQYMKNKTDRTDKDKYDQG